MEILRKKRPEVLAVGGEVIAMIRDFVIINLRDSMCQNELFHMRYSSIKNAFACCLE